MPHPRSHILVVVADGRKASLLDDSGTALKPHLHLTQSLESTPNPPTRVQGTDKPGRAFQSVGSMRSAMEQTDWHEMQEQQFARDVVAAVKSLHQQHPVDGLILVAPPRTLSYLRQEMPEPLKKLVRTEIDKDLTHCTPKEIEQHLTPA
ncbi:host attachment protein [Microvirga terricola]|uniref:Host attachment protein n=1 Tax=Microvirga terricola TaxID=2719797 RepID=A0ABX0VBL7_9HYPH|nr:host attachment family protein [Microvirga terricola]NIX76370.1 host attachment protein [Microvirga terricola]